MIGVLDGLAQAAGGCAELGQKAPPARCDPADETRSDRRAWLRTLLRRAGQPETTDDRDIA